MKKIICFVVAFLLSLVLFCACSGNDNYIRTVSAEERFVTVGYEPNECEVIVDAETRVMYLFVKNGYGGGLTVMVDADGNPLIYEGDLP